MNASKEWVKNLKDAGYEHHCNSLQDLAQTKKLGRIWKETLRRTGIKPPTTMFELGCGGGKYLSTLALNGFEVHGIDVSPEVVSRCQNYLLEVSKFADIPVLATVENADIFHYQSTEKYDLTYHFGVVEHFLDLSERMIVWQKLYELTKPGGWMMSAVPNGSHFWRGYIRQNHLCGYHIPEVDYSVKLHEQEFLDTGLQDVIAIPWNYFGFAKGIVHGKLNQAIAKFIYLSSNVLIPLAPFPRTAKEKFAHGLLVIGKRPMSIT
jgi:2-polyprenyl-3-methyl-5-hydroxy-6-metoxy-1,4-benzoquinol methylase